MRIIHDWLGGMVIGIVYAISAFMLTSIVLVGVVSPIYPSVIFSVPTIALAVAALVFYKSTIESAKNVARFIQQAKIFVTKNKITVYFPHPLKGSAGMRGFIFYSSGGKCALSRCSKGWKSSRGAV